MHKFVLRVKSGWLKISAVETRTPGKIIWNCISSVSTGCRTSPMPSANAVWPKTKKGTSAPRLTPSPQSSCRVNPSPHIWFKPMSTVAASEDPPPRPAPSGIFFLTVIRTPLSGHFSCRSLAAFQQRSLSTDQLISPALSIFPSDNSSRSM